MNAAEKTALTSASLTAYIIECGAEAVAYARKQGWSTASINVSAARLHSEYGAPELAKQPAALASIPSGGLTWSVARSRCGNGRVLWVARAVLPAIGAGQ